MDKNLKYKPSLSDFVSNYTGYSIMCHSVYEGTYSAKDWFPISGKEYNDFFIFDSQYLAVRKISTSVTETND